MAIGYCIQVHGHDLFFTIVLFKLDGSHPFLKLTHHQLPFTQFTPGKKIFCQLLGQGTSPAPVVSTYQAICHPSKSFDVNTGMIEETDVFCGKQCLYQIGWQVIKMNIRTFSI